jgi:SAM-dependent methyltransferase
VGLAINSTGRQKIRLGRLKMAKFKGYDIVDKYPEDGWLKGYFYVVDEDIRNSQPGSGKAYRDLGALKHKDLCLNLLEVKKGEKILDVGCEAGAMMVYAGLLGAEVSGVDICAESVEKANKYLAKFSIKGKAVVGDARKLDFPDNHFDKAISSDFFEHLSAGDNIQVLNEIKRVVKPGGSIVIKTPNLTYLKWARVFKMFRRILQLRNPFSVVIPHTTGDAHQHVGLLTKSGLAKILRAAGFLNFKFYYSFNSKIERNNYALAEFLSWHPIFRNIFSEELIVVLKKPVILSFFPDQ